VLKNLISNALKFTEHGEVRCGSSQHFPGGTGDLEFTQWRHRFEVRDTGIGIAADKQKLIFEAFQQADGTTSRKYGGTGLGLSISREIARRLAEKFSLLVSQGSTFTPTCRRPRRERERGE